MPLELVRSPEIEPSRLIPTIRQLTGWSSSELARRLGASFYSVSRWERGDAAIAPADESRLRTLLDAVSRGAADSFPSSAFASTGVRDASNGANEPAPPAIRFRRPSNKNLVSHRLSRESFWGTGASELLESHSEAAPTVSEPVAHGVSAGKNTYTYDAHTYHTKVPPQGIAEVIRRYLPKAPGLVLDPFAGSGMTGVAALTEGHDVILNELSPAASFISNRFTTRFDAGHFMHGVNVVCARLQELRSQLYSTTCRECSKTTEILHTIWSYQVACPKCNHSFVLWDHCRSYGQTVREHKILSEFPCPGCQTVINKSRLVRSKAVPVMLAYKCCSRSIAERDLNDEDRARIAEADTGKFLAAGWYPRMPLPDGVNLNQPKRHGLTSIDKFYSSRNLSAMSHIWKEINSIADGELSGFLAFTFTSLYQRVTRLSEFRFWGGSGNTARFNVPQIFNESNVFLTFERKARTISDHLATTAKGYRGRCAVRTGSATSLDFLPSSSVDLIFTDPPFGANINYSEMNLLWESWLGQQTDARTEAIVSKAQGKDVHAYENLMAESLSECYRVLRDKHWMVLVFMISSEPVWQAIKSAILRAGFAIRRIDIFDKQHGTFKHFVSENTAGCDLMIHCQKVTSGTDGDQVFREAAASTSVAEFLSGLVELPRVPYLHVQREPEIDYRLLYSQFLSQSILKSGDTPNFADFRKAARSALEKN